jgi:hypothetical protein
MGMTKILGFLIAALGLGAGLALFGVHVPLPVGSIGAGLLIAWAVLVRRRWDRQRAVDGGDPGAPERRVWQRLAGTSAIVGHLAVILLNPQVDLHFGSGNWLAIDGWCLFVGSYASAFVLRVNRRERDERDDQIDARATRMAYYALITLVVVLLMYLAYATRPMQAGLSKWVIANILFGFIFVSQIAGQVTQLIGYSRDRP